MRSFTRFLMASLVLFTSAGAARAIGYCYDLCGSNAYCGQSCLDDYDQFTTCESYGQCNPDIDGDGVLWNVDNCPGTYNPGQENCDGDSFGNFCDSENGTYQLVSGSNQKCQIVGRTHVVYSDVQVRYNATYRDVSACGSPDKCSATTGPQHTCWGMSAWDCCVANYGAYDCILYLNNNTCSC